ncbi:MAG: uracil-DNA glycosylase [Spirochaetes bacterium]|nr:MAG: uracil-DNA glycosylase [Spirochaetota bacterium]
MMNSKVERFNRLLDLSMDYLEDGVRREHREIEAGAGIRKEDSLTTIEAEIAACSKCRLCENRNKTVPGKGVLNPKVMIIGEGPGAEEDKTGIPFVGRAGQYMDKWMDAIDLKRDKDLFIGNIVKCRPPGNRDPHPDEIEACRGYLERQIKILKPSLIMTVGRIAAQELIGSSSGIGRLRGRMYDYMGIPLIPTYHPSGVLRNPENYRKPVWEDLKAVRKFLDSL